jgi:transcriptional regulator with XRE-family HTH domain
MDIKKSFGKSLRAVRKARGLSQEDFSIASSRTYLSTLERGLKSPTLDKIDSLADRMDIHPITLLTLTYLGAQNQTDLVNLLKRIQEETTVILKTTKKKF